MRSFLIIVITSLLLTSCLSQKSVLDKQLYKSVGPFIHYYEGIQNRLYGDYESAIKNLTFAQSLDPNNDAIYYEVAISYNMIGETKDAIANLEKAVELNPKNKHYRNLLGMFYINQKQFDKALSNQEELVNIDSININYKFQLALLHSEQKNFDEAISLLNALEDQVGYNVRLAETRLRILIERTDFNKALDEVNSIIAVDNQNPLFLLYKSEIHFKMGEDSIAFKVINDAIELDPDNPQPQIELYQRFLEIGNYPKALQTLEKLHQNENISAEEKVRLFYPLLFEQTIYTLHSETVDRIIDSLLINHPDEVFVHELSYEHYIRRRKFDTARHELQILTLLDDENPDRWEKLISFDYSIGKKELVIYNSIKASKQYPTKSIFYIFQALVLDELKDTENAIFVLNQGIGNVTDVSELNEMLGTLGDMYYKVAKFDLAFSTYDRALKYDPNNARVLNNYSYYLSVLNKQLDKALDMSTKAVEVDPNNSTYIDTKGWVLFQMGKFDEALEVLRNAIAKSGSTSAVINEHYGDALYKTGNKENAYIYWKKAKEIGGGSDKLDEKLRTRKYVP